MYSSHYLGPDKPRFAPTSWDDVGVAAAAGILDEGRWVELKKDVPAKGAGANKELAKDLASLSVDGGTLVIGIEEASAGVAGSVVGSDLNSLQTRINQVSRATIHPALHVSTQTFDHPTDDRLGILVVSVPASASAPHMVDGAYWGRTEHGKTTLSDAEIRRLMDARRSVREGFAARLDSVGEILRAPELAKRATGQLVLRFEPLAPGYGVPPSDAMESLGYPREAIVRLVKGTHGAHQPRLVEADQPYSHPDGWFATSRRKRDVDAHEKIGLTIPEMTRVSVLVDDNGAWSIVSGCATRPTGSDPTSTELCIYTKHILELTHVVCGAVATFSTDVAPYFGQWQVGIAIDNLAGLKPAEAYNDLYLFADIEPYSRPNYQAVVTTSTQELEERPSDIVGGLLKNFLRGMGLEKRYLPYTKLSDKISP